MSSFSKGTSAVAALALHRHVTHRLVGQSAFVSTKLPIEPIVDGSSYTWELKDLPFLDAEDESGEAKPCHASPSHLYRPLPAPPLMPLCLDFLG